MFRLFLAYTIEPERNAQERLTCFIYISAFSLNSSLQNLLEKDYYFVNLDVIKDYSKTVEPREFTEKYMEIWRAVIENQVINQNRIFNIKFEVLMRRIATFIRKHYNTDINLALYFNLNRLVKIERELTAYYADIQEIYKKGCSLRFRFIGILGVALGKMLSKTRRTLYYLKFLEDEKSKIENSRDTPRTISAKPHEGFAGAAANISGMYSFEAAVAQRPHSESSNNRSLHRSQTKILVDDHSQSRKRNSWTRSQTRLFEESKGEALLKEYGSRGELQRVDSRPKAQMFKRSQTMVIGEQAPSSRLTERALALNERDVRETQFSMRIQKARISVLPPSLAAQGPQLVTNVAPNGLGIIQSVLQTEDEDDDDKNPQQHH
eukprot:TRINITY_DN1605_c0_g1_i1.p1 TRINITY_DN1605_c0_g1~~TRINITY_DN1605_c0_g1_i1.p1  ORF type:complete len:378 (+),score=26.90 TRINITY_DN1605_c0_g1_i1:340-1473(+)